MKNTELTLYDIALNEEEYVKENTALAFDSLFNMLELLDTSFSEFDGKEKNDIDYLTIFAIHSSIETSLVYLDGTLDGILDAANRILPLSKVKDIKQKEKKKIKELSESVFAAVEDFVSSCDEILEYFSARQNEDAEDHADALYMLTSLENILPNLEMIVDSYYDTAIWASEEFESYYEEEEEKDEE